MEEGTRIWKRALQARSPIEDVSIELLAILTVKWWYLAVVDVNTHSCQDDSQSPPSLWWWWRWLWIKELDEGICVNSILVGNSARWGSSDQKHFPCGSKGVDTGEIWLLDAWSVKVQLSSTNLTWHCPLLLVWPLRLHISLPILLLGSLGEGCSCLVWSLLFDLNTVSGVCTLFR